MSSTKVKPRTKKLQRKLWKQRLSLLTSIDNWKKRKKIVFGLVCVFVMCLSLLGMYKNYMEKQNAEIEKTIVRYYMAMSNKDIEELKRNIYPDNEVYTNGFILDMFSKMGVINFNSIKLETIYPALIDGNIAIVGYVAETKGSLKQENIIFKEIGTTVLIKKNDMWYIAKPIDLQNVSSDYLNNFFNKYENVLRENMTEKEAENVVKSQKYLFSIVKEN